MEIHPEERSFGTNGVYWAPRSDYNTEAYEPIIENDFLSAMEEPLSTFSIDVDYASYANVRRFLQHGQRPPKGAVRIEEFINYFDYDYAQPKGTDPFSVTSEIASCPWNPAHRLVHIGLQGKMLAKDKAPPSNLVFLIDVSGSMSDYDKLPLLKNAFSLLLSQLRTEDRVAIVVYAGASGLVLPSTSGADKHAIRKALSQLESGGSTAGAAGIRLAYDVAKRNFIKGGNNRVILATDGDFNVGVSSESELLGLIETKREEDVFLSVLGFGTGNYQDSKMELLADNGNGQYAYIDNINEARKVLVNELTSTLYTIAKDVKIQVEFNPTKVSEYRLIGYENRKLKNEDFNNDKKDAGDIGAGHSVTALYEIVPAETGAYLSSNVDALKYQDRSIKTSASGHPEMMTIKLRYKQPDGKTSKLIQFTAQDKMHNWSKTSDNFRFSAAVASFAMLLRDSKYKGISNYNLVEQLAKTAKGKDQYGYRNEFIGLVDMARVFSPINLDVEKE